MKKILIVMALLLAPAAWAQVSNPSIIPSPIAPSGACVGALPLQVVTPAGTLYACQNGVWTVISGGAGGSGTVQSGSGYALPAYGSGASTTVGPSQITTDATGQVLSTGGASAAGSNQVVTWGDSLTVGSEDGTGITYPNRLQVLTGAPTVNLGIGGQPSGSIAVRMNAYAGQSQQTFASGFTLPTSGTVTVTFPAGYEPAVGLGFSTGYYASGVPLQFVVGGVTYQGNITWNGTIYTLQPTAYPASPVTVASGTAWTAILPANALNGCQVIWSGRNDPLATPAAAQANIAAQVAVANANSKCYVVLSVLNGANDGNYISSILAFNSYLAATYPGHYLDVRSTLVADFNPANAADVIDNGNNIPPYSLRAQDLSGTVTAIGTTSTCAITFSNSIATNNVITIGTEKINLTGGSNGAWTCVRGYAGTTAATYSSGTAYTGVDSLHLGQNISSPANAAGQRNGYQIVAQSVATWLAQQSLTVPNQNGLNAGIASTTVQPANGNPLIIQTPVVATSTANVSSPVVQITGNLMTSTGSQPAGFTLQAVPGSTSGTSSQIILKWVGFGSTATSSPYAFGFPDAILQPNSDRNGSLGSSAAGRSWGGIGVWGSAGGNIQIKSSTGAILSDLGNGTFQIQGGLRGTGSAPLGQSGGGWGGLVLNTAAPTTAAGEVSYGATTAATATAGAATLPANPVGFLIVNIGGTTFKIPYYAN